MARQRAIFLSATNTGNLIVKQPIRLVVGLGNPGREYEKTRHNAGFWFVDTLARDYRVTLRKEARFFGETGRLSEGGADCWLLKPATFMNRSGQSVAALAAYFKISPEQILVVHDEIDHDAGSARLKRGGGHGGHNGLRDIISALGSKDFLRLRLGVGHPGDSRQVVNYVLGLASREDAELLDDAIERSCRQFSKLLDGDEAGAMNALNGSQPAT